MLVHSIQVIKRGEHPTNNVLCVGNDSKFILDMLNFAYETYDKFCWSCWPDLNLTNYLAYDIEKEELREFPVGDLTEEDISEQCNRWYVFKGKNA